MTALKNRRPVQYKVNMSIKVSTEFLDNKRTANDRWESSQKKKNKSAFRVIDNPNSDLSTFQNRRTTKSQSGESQASFLMIQAKIRTERSESMELIPACVPESVGFEIENILHSSFGHSKPTYNLETDFRNKNKKPGIKKPSPQKKKSPRTLSTEDLHPNLLPEDYLDEVISQYFNNDSSSDDQHSGKKISTSRRESLNKYFSDNSSNEDDNEEEDDYIQEKIIEEGEPVKPAKNKIKTDEEIESEYKHIIFGAKKRKGPRLGLGSPKKKKKASKERGCKARDEKDDKTFTKPLKIEKLIMKKERKLEDKPAIFDNNGNNKGKTIKTETEPSHNKFSNMLPCKTNDLTLQNREDNLTQKWAGKRASTKAIDRSKLLLSGKKLFTSPKIEDVTGKYSKEEELVTCGICHLLDPPVDPSVPQSSVETTEWVGCDCYRWFHKSCTQLTKFTEKFSCKSVRMRCQEPASAAPEPVTPPAVLQVAILRFIRDRDVSFIEDLLW